MIIHTEQDLKRSNIARLLNKYKNLNKRSVSVGIHKKDNKPYPNSKVTTAEVGLFHEFGTERLEPRVWLRIFTILEAEKDDLLKQIEISLKENDNIDKALDEIGAYMKDRIKDRILSNEVTPPSDNKTGITLVDTGQLVNSIDYEVH